MIAGQLALTVEEEEKLIK